MFHKIENEGKLPNYFYEANIFIPKANMNSERKSYRYQKIQ